MLRGFLFQIVIPGHCKVLSWQKPTLFLNRNPISAILQSISMPKTLKFIQLQMIFVCFDHRCHQLVSILDEKEQCTSGNKRCHPKVSERKNVMMATTASHEYTSGFKRSYGGIRMNHSRNARDGRNQPCWMEIRDDEEGA